MRKQSRSTIAPDLHVHSTFSLLDGMGSPKAVVDRAVELGWGAACLTEHGNMGSVPSFYQECRKAKIKPIIGCEMYVVPDAILGEKSKETRSASRHLTALALSVEGYHNLVAWVNESMQTDVFYYRPRISIERMIEMAPYPMHHNVILSGCLGSEICQNLLSMNGTALAAAQTYVLGMKDVFPNFYVEVQNHQHEKFMGRGFKSYEEMVEKETLVRSQLVAVAQATGTKIVLTNDSHFQSSKQRKAHIAMMASKMKNWAKEDTHRGAQSEERQSAAFLADYSYWTSYMQSLETLAGRTDGIDESVLANTLEIVAEADIRLDPLDNFSYSVPFSGYDDPVEKIKRRSKRRLASLVRKHGPSARERFDHELAAMGDFGHYLLIMSDFIINARKMGILTNTRGSAANSIVCYCLEIHDIDSIHYKLTFERFVNPERKKLPDIDIDIEHDRYEDFMKFVKEYMIEREGEGQVFQICNYGTLSNRSTFRMVAESLGVPQETMDEIASLLPQMIDSGLVDEDDDAYTALKDNYPELYDLAAGVFDNLKNVSQHACGWIFGTKDRPLEKWIPMYLIASSGRLVTQYDYKQIEKFGLNKGDFLRLKTLSVVSRCLKAVGMNPLDLQKIPLDDEKTFERLREGRTEGIFTLQGKTNRQGVMEIEAANEHDVIASVAIYRPALTRPGYHNVYNKRRRGEEEISYPHPVAEAILGESYGLPIFQEQILDLGYAVGMGHTGAQDLLNAIKLAKGVGRGAKEAFAEVEPQFMDHAMKMMTKKEAEGVWDLVASFQGYGFNRGHSTSYGTLAVRAAYLAAHFPQDFFVSLLDVYPEKHKYVAAARAEGFKLLPPDINESVGGFSKGHDEKTIRIGLSRIDGVGPVALNAILRGQPFSGVDDLRERCSRTAIKSTTMENLATIGAFRSFGIRATENETEIYSLLKFLLDRPRAMQDVKPKHVKSRTSERGWSHIGLQSGVELSEMKQSVSKLFWIPELPTDELLKLKASAWARVKTYLLIAIDENGLPFTLLANEDKPGTVDYLKFIAKLKGAVICANGSIRKPFDNDGPLGFRFDDISGCYQGEPQVWGVTEKQRAAFNVLHRRKFAANRAAQREEG